MSSVFRLRLLLVAQCCSLFLGPAAVAETVVGVVRDGPQVRQLIPLAGIRAEVAKLTGNEFDVRFPRDKQLEGDWTLEGAREVFERQLADRDVDIVLCLGVLVCHVAGGHPDLVKPTIAAVVSDTRLQNFPFADGASGKRNLVYVTNLHSVDDDLRDFDTAAGISTVAILVDGAMLADFRPFLDAKIRTVTAEQGLSIVAVPVGASLSAAVAAIPADVDAVYVTPLFRFDDAGMRLLADELIERRLKSFSMFGVSEVRDGLLMSSSGRPEDLVRVTRRLALNVQRILLGDKPENIPVFLQESRRLAINMRTAAAIDFSPRYAVLADAEQLSRDVLEGGESMALLDAMLEAVEANLDLAVAAFEPLLADEDTRMSRAELLPQVELGGTWQKIDPDRALGEFFPETTADVTIGGRQLVYSDSAWAGYRINRYLEAASDEEYRAAMLDTLRNAGLAYLNVLRTLSLENVRRSNLEVTRTNLELARIRESIGFSGRADVLRWDTQIARDRSNLIDAETSRRQAEDRLNQVLNRPQTTRILPTDASVNDVLSFFTRGQFLALIDNARTWQTLQNFVVERGLETAPEVRAVGYFVAAGERRLTAARRRYWVPDIVAAGEGGRNIDRTTGAGTVPGFALDDDTWQVGVEATLPIFSGGALRAEFNRSRYALRQAERRREAVTQEVETRIRIALEQVANSYSAIELTAAAAAASGENLRIVTDSYSNGAVSVITLIDAQNSALGSDLAAAEAKYLYLRDIIEVLRVAGDFSLMLDPQYFHDWFRDVDDYFRQRGVELGN
ncbi:MAG: TolC family protein [Gammaproteobacteria bacterium]